MPTSSHFEEVGELHFAIGSQLTLAGHRYHQYQSNILFAAQIAEQLRTPPTENMP